MARHFVQATDVLIMYMIISALLAMDTEPFVALYIYRHINFITCKSKYESKNNGVTIPLTYMVGFKIVYPKSLWILTFVVICKIACHGEFCVRYTNKWYNH